VALPSKINIPSQFLDPDFAEVIHWKFPSISYSSKVIQVLLCCHSFLSFEDTPLAYSTPRWPSIISLKCRGPDLGCAYMCPRKMSSQVDNFTHMGRRDL
jgi:hypothetical protein